MKKKMKELKKLWLFFFAKDSLISSSFQEVETPKKEKKLQVILRVKRETWESWVRRENEFFFFFLLWGLNWFRVIYRRKNGFFFITLADLKKQKNDSGRWITTDL